MKNGAWLGGYGWLSLLGIVIPIAVACGNATDGPTDPRLAAASAGAPQTVDDFSQRFASSYCQSIADCCSRQGFDGSNCQTTLKEQLRAQLQLSASNPKIHFNAQAAQACIAAYAAGLSACTNRVLFRKADDACDPLFEGTVPLGGECGNSSECAPSATAGVTCMTGICALSPASANLYGGPRRQLGETCSGTCDETPGSTSCEPLSGAQQALGACWLADGVACSSGVCVAAQKVGEACSADKHCETTAHCLGGVCVADSSSGPCTQSDQCLPATSRCDYTLKMCIPLKPNGEACDQSDQCLGGQCYQHHCRTWSVAEPGSCLGVLDD